MDLTTRFPRSPRATLAGLVMLARTTDKARAYNAGTPGPYHYGCGMDRHVLAFLGTDSESYAKTVAALGDDLTIESWAKSKLAGKSDSDIATFNAEFAEDGPETGSDSERFYKAEQQRLHRDDIKSWFELLDVDEGRDVPHRAAA
ncbi:MAG TPA: DUF5069 domain-containing protein [Candidatus Binatus sp.]|nr:DUF5069 domain-containing protein [Candidatus Binatus sp.]